jgi:HAD superfamily hydrolase (TIGR01458 family)
MFRRLTDGASLIAMHRNRYWMTADGLQMDAGAYVAALEYAAGVSATICGKPAQAYFEGALGSLGVMPERALMVGDDVTNDVVGAQLAGLTGVLVRTGKFRPSDLQHEPPPQHVIDSLASLPSLLGA